MSYRTEVRVSNRVGLHARPAATLVKEAMKYPCRLALEFEGRSANAKSILDVLALGVSKDGLVTVVAEGSGAEEAVAGLVKFIEDGLGELP